MKMKGNLKIEKSFVQKNKHEVQSSKISNSAKASSTKNILTGNPKIKNKLNLFLGVFWRMT